ncbi:hypothetical protein [Gloeobacter violaceus]|uniref:hypothetical protein n=1 Tax=Gloeobacter violaceus TaxID=33072 RepID=UPI0013E8B2A7|nr:hypothetical protein [Gloeobacter violaceus]
MRFSIVPLAVSLLAACTSVAPPPSPCEAGLVARNDCLARSNQQEYSQDIQVGLFVDGTDSMRGYVTRSGTTTRYQELLRALEDALQQFPQSSRQAYKFGTRVEALPERRLNIVAGKDPGFYGGVGLYTEIERVLSDRYIPTKPNYLAVIVTDLYQRGTDVTSLVRLLKTRYLDKNWVVGLVGIESLFAGRVYDLDTAEANRSIKANRPVYALVIGTQANVAHYFDALKRANRTLEQSAQFVIFSGQPLKAGVNFFAEAPLLDSQDDGGLISMGLLEDGRTFWFRQQGQADRATFRVCPRLSLLPYAVGLDGQGDWQSRVAVLEPESSPKTVPWVDAVQVRSDPAACSTEPQSPLPTGTPLGLAISVNTKLLSNAQEGDYFFEVNLRPAPGRYPSWWDSWNTEDGVGEPSRTLHLKQFLRSLQAVALGGARRELSIPFYIRR